MPKQNRPLVRDGRIQAPKKRTDRSYLSPASAPEPVAEEIEDERAPVEPSVSAAPIAAATAAPVAQPRQYQRASGAARAIQQQGVRKRRDVDVHALAERDTRYAMHELRRILIFATMVVVTLIVLGIVLR